MPGAYAHITAVKHMVTSNLLDQLQMPNSFKRAVTLHNEFAILGAVSPDYPYLHLGNSESCEWADLMHQKHVGDLFHNATRLIAALPEGKEKDRCIAWFFGYASHVGMDMTVHPIVEAKVGIYEQNKKEHRICEMNQDVHIWQRMGLGTVGRGETIDVLRSCNNSDNDALAPEIKELWDEILKATYPDHWQIKPPRIDKWHSMFSHVVDVVEESYQIPRFARHVAANTGTSYPIPDEVDQQYITGLKTPKGGQMHYDDIFDYALNNVGKVWEWLAAGIGGNDVAMSNFTEWNLDRGMDETHSHPFWR